MIAYDKLDDMELATEFKKMMDEVVARGFLSAGYMQQVRAMVRTTDRVAKERLVEQVMKNRK